MYGWILNMDTEIFLIGDYATHFLVEYTDLHFPEVASSGENPQGKWSIGEGEAAI